MVRTQIYLDEDQSEVLSSIARKEKTSRSELIRAAIRSMIAKKAGERDPLYELIGQAGKAGRGDGSRRHDRYIYGKSRS